MAGKPFSFAPEAHTWMIIDASDRGRVAEKGKGSGVVKTVPKYWFL